MFACYKKSPLPPSSLPSLPPSPGWQSAACSGLPQPESVASTLLLRQMSAGESVACPQAAPTDVPAFNWGPKRPSSLLCGLRSAARLGSFPALGPVLSVGGCLPPAVDPAGCMGQAWRPVHRTQSLLLRAVANVSLAKCLPRWKCSGRRGNIPVPLMGTWDQGFALHIWISWSRSSRAAASFPDLEAARASALQAGGVCI